ncbi:hypothetical protein DEO72_LG9g1498 [Vigna unguiculata]|uniref:Zinc finger GRF-type domain-containing protein n=1 Tax=Vigna unguiculata TaxID=3917 RepID=A0A4D6N301_VIGUN|nr:hypothetical protein DEO72_LG9g1498 [Vigna unguiculata]
MSCGPSLSSYNSWGQHGGGSRVLGGAPIYDHGELTVVQITRTVKNLGKQFWGCVNFKRRGEDMVKCNFFRLCFEDSVDERDDVILRQRKRIFGLEKSVRVWKKRFQLSIAGMLFLV